MDYFISDTHFGHENILTFERTQFQTIKDHDECIWSLIESTVRSTDTLYHLGDFGRLTPENLERWNNLSCKTILIRGNHDTSITKLKNVFDEVHKEPIFYTKRILLSHEPLPVTDETLNVHGHLHGANLIMPNYLNISIHQFDYKLANAKNLSQKVNTIPKINWKFMFEWYAKDYNFTIPNKDVIFDQNGEIDLKKTQKHLLSEKAKRKEDLAKQDK